MTGAPSIAVVIPAFRVAQHIGAVVAAVPDVVEHVVVVDDASDDGTADAVLRVGEPRVHLLQHRARQGVGGAMLTGYAAALRLGADVVVKMDGDGQMDAAHLPILLAPLLRGEADYAKGNRFLHAYALRRMPLARRLGNFVLSFLTKLASGYWNIFDPSNGYTAVHATVLRLLDTGRIGRDYFFESSMLLELRRLGAVVRDVPMPARYDDEPSSMSLRRVFVTFPGRLVRGLWRRLVWQYFLFDFSAASVLMLLGVPLVLFGVVFGAVHWYESIKTGIVATTGTVLLAVLPIILGVQFLVEAISLDIASVPRLPLHRQVLAPDALVSHTSRLADYLERHRERVTGPDADRLLKTTVAESRERSRP